MSIIEQIKQLDETWVASSEAYGVRTTMKNADLQSLAESHDRLLKAAKQFAEHGVWYNSSRDADVVDDAELDLLKTAIAEAERLSEPTSSHPAEGEKE